MPDPLFLPNNVKPVPLDEANLKNALKTLQEAIAKSIALLADLFERTRDDDAAYSSKKTHIYTGDSGIALMFLRLSVQFNDAGLHQHLPPTFRAKLPSLISRFLPDSAQQLNSIKHGRFSPLDTASGPTLMYVLASLSFPAVDFGHGVMAERDAWHAAIKTLRSVRRLAVEDEQPGGDEVLYGRAGLLWALVNLRVWMDDNTGGIDGHRRDDLRKVVPESIKAIVEQIIINGKTGAMVYERGHNGQSLPLMWEWHGKYYLGAIHGVAGILTVLLQAPREIVQPHLQAISTCISALCSLVKQSNGHLPSSLPERPKAAHLVQICHGAPGYLLLMTTVRSRYPKLWQPDWEEAETMARDCVWKEGLLRKGLGLCHGISGNAWPLLLLGITIRGTAEGNIALSQSIAMLLQATRLPPLDDSQDALQYRTPDHPASLFEGLAGAITAWLDACVAIRALLQEDKTPHPVLKVLGIPGLGGIVAHGLL